MTIQATQDIIETAITKTAEMNPQETDGEWLEVVTVEAGSSVPDNGVTEKVDWNK